ncbi:MAG: cupin domain-containing protein [Bacteroidia bacterium]
MNKETLTKPEMTVSQIGEHFKILKVKGIKGMEMPSHISTREAVIIVIKGEAVLKLPNKEINLKANESTIIPAKEPHTLTINEDFQANVIMEIESEIKFVTK